MATVIAKMKTCGKTHKVIVTPNDEGNYDVEIISDCHKVEEFGKKLKYVTLEDIIDFENSRINKREFRGDMSPPCLCPIAVLDAAWIEAGMLSKSLVNKVQENTISFEEVQ